MSQFRLTLDGRAHEVSILETSIIVDGERFETETVDRGRVVVVRVDGRPLRVEIPEAGAPRLRVRVGDREYDLGFVGRAPPAAIIPPLPPQTANAPGAVLSPMAGRVLRLAVKEGDAVEAGDLLFILEAMKMENEIRAPRAGVVQRVDAAEGQRVAEGTPVVTIG